MEVAGRFPEIREPMKAHSDIHVSTSFLFYCLFADRVHIIFVLRYLEEVLCCLGAIVSSVHRNVPSNISNKRYLVLVIPDVYLYICLYTALLCFA